MKGLVFILAVLSLCVSVFSAIEWPSGIYSLIAPKTGCPSGWKLGWRYQDNDNTRNKNKITTRHHFYGFFSKDMMYYYCTKTSYHGPRLLPPGNYCIMRYGSRCPSGFTSGSIYWDDEDTDNKNGRNGYLPSGSYNTNTRIYYCCRRDGSAYHNITLPTTDPFYLMRYTSSCQKITGMSVRQEIIETDDENSNNVNSVSGSHPKVTGTRNHRLYYCYYNRTQLG